MVPAGKVLNGRESHRRRRLRRRSPACPPSSVILSSVAVALTLPSALYLVSFACVEKVMSSLLGRPREDGDNGGGVEIPEDEESPDFGHFIRRAPQKKSVVLLPKTFPAANSEN